MDLYINNIKCVLEEEFNPNFTYSFLDTYNPSAIKASYSKTVTLPDCAENSLALSPFKDRYDFVLYEENRIMEKGYCTLDSIEEEGFRKVYNLTLYGILGSFFYNLQGDSGSNKTLLDINLGFGESLAADNAFTQSITPDFVYQGWRGSGAVSDILKLVPCTWNLGGFDYTKTIIDNSDNLFPVSSSDGTSTCRVSGSINYLLVSAEENTPYAKMDFRLEYMPVAIRYKNIIEGCCKPSENGGYQVNLDPDFFNDSNPYWTDMYLMNTVPAAESSGESGEHGEVYTNFFLRRNGQPDPMTISTMVSQSKYLTPSGSQGHWTYDGYGYLSTTEVIAGNQLNLSISPRFNFSSAPSVPYQFAIGQMNSLGLKVTIEDGNSAAVIEGTNFWMYNDDPVEAQGNQTEVYLPAKEFSLTIPDNWTKFRIKLEFKWSNTSQGPSFRYRTGGQVWTAISLAGGSNYGTIGSEEIQGQLTTTFFDPDVSLLNDVIFSKKAYLSNSKTPLEYLLNYTKMFNLRFYVHPGQKIVDVLTLPNYLTQKGVVDISDRIDYSRDFTVTRNIINEGVINFNLQPENNTTVQKYYDEEGQNILDRRVRVSDATGIKDYLGNSILRVGTRSRQESAFAIRNLGSYSYYGFNQAEPYTLGYVSGSQVKNEEYGLNYVDSPSRYDMLEVQDPTNVVVMFAGTRENPFGDLPAIISRNSKEMMRYAGKPCFLGGFKNSLADGATGTMFGSAFKATKQIPVFSLTPNYPDALYGISFANENYDSILVSSNLFDLYFKDFIDKIYIKPKKVTCWVRLENPETRCLYWFENAYWILTEISDYNYNDDPVKCTFLQYQV